MNKPLEVMMTEFKSKLIEVVNNSGLPLSISRILMNEVYEVIKEKEIETTTKIVTDYYNNLKEENKEDNKEC